MNAAQKEQPRNDKEPVQGLSVVAADSEFNKQNSTLTTIICRVDYSLVATCLLMAMVVFSAVTGGGLNHA